MQNKPKQIKAKQIKTKQIKTMQYKQNKQNKPRTKIIPLYTQSKEGPWWS